MVVGGIITVSTTLSTHNATFIYNSVCKLCKSMYINVVPGILITVTVRMSNKYCLRLSLSLSLLRNIICFAKPSNECNTILIIIWACERHE